MKKHLKPCPFCGKIPILKEVGNNRTKSRYAQIKCTNCFTVMEVGALKNTIEWCVEIVIKQWNKRIGLNDYNEVIIKAFNNSETALYEKKLCCPLDKSCIKREIDWSKVPVDACCEITINAGVIIRRHFSHYDKVMDTINCFYDGHSSFTYEKGSGTAQWQPSQVKIVKM